MNIESKTATVTQKKIIEKTTATATTNKSSY